MDWTYINLSGCMLFIVVEQLLVDGWNHLEIGSSNHTTWLSQKMKNYLRRTKEVRFIVEFRGRNMNNVGW